MCVYLCTCVFMFVFVLCVHCCVCVCVYVLGGMFVTLSHTVAADRECALSNDDTAEPTEAVVDEYARACVCAFVLLFVFVCVCVQTQNAQYTHTVHKYI